MHAHVGPTLLELWTESDQRGPLRHTEKGCLKSVVFRLNSRNVLISHEVVLGTYRSLVKI
jgi:hypothetical protein